MISIERTGMKKIAIHKYLKILSSVCHELMSLPHVTGYVSYSFVAFIGNKHMDMGAHLGPEKRCFQ